MKRQKTKYQGVYTIKGIEGIIFYAKYRKAEKIIEEKIGYKKTGMTAKKANDIRSKRMLGLELSNRERREQEQTERTINQLWKEYKTLKTEYKNLRIDQSRFENYLKKSFGNKKPKEITRLEIRRLKTKLLSKLSPGATKLTLALLVRIINFGVKNDLCEPLPFSIEYPVINNIKNDALDIDQIKALLKSIESDTNKEVGRIMKLALFTGMRKSEILNLTWADVDFLKGFLTLRNTKSGKDKIIPLNQQSKTIFQNMTITSRNDLIFPGRNGQKRQNITKPARRIIRKAGISDNVRPLHSLRHTFASQLANSGADAHTLQKLMTHSSPTMTQRYVHLSDRVLREASEKIGEIIYNSERKKHKVEVPRVT
jgi:integrase